MKYEVHTHYYGRKLITADGPCQGLLEWPQHRWVRVSRRPLGFVSAQALADEQPMHATVIEWQSSNKVYDNGKIPAVPDGWYPASANTPGEN